MHLADRFHATIGLSNILAPYENPSWVYTLSHELGLARANELSLEYEDEKEDQSLTYLLRASVEANHDSRIFCGLSAIEWHSTRLTCSREE